MNLITLLRAGEGTERVKKWYGSRSRHQGRRWEIGWVSLLIRGLGSVAQRWIPSRKYIW